MVRKSRLIGTPVRRRFPDASMSVPGQKLPARRAPSRPLYLNQGTSTVRRRASTSYQKRAGEWTDGYKRNTDSRLGDPPPHSPDPRKTRHGNISRLQGKLAHERAGHDDVVRAQPSPVLAQFFGEPLYRIQRMSK